MKKGDVFTILGGILTIVGGVLTAYGLYFRNKAKWFMDGAGYLSNGYYSWENKLSHATTLVVCSIIVAVIGAILLTIGIKAIVSNYRSTQSTTNYNSSADTRLKELANLRDSDVITEEEYEEKRKKIIDEI